VGSAEAGLQAKGEAQCVSFAQKDVSGEDEQFVELIGSTDITMPRTIIYLAPVEVSAISHQSSLCQYDTFRYTIQ
jgi:hypothetical protein